MNTCDKCKFFEKSKNNGETYGSCTSDKLLGGYDMILDLPEDPPDIAIGGGYTGYGDFIQVGPKFGCIHFQAKDY